MPTRREAAVIGAAVAPGVALLAVLFTGLGSGDAAPEPTRPAPFVVHPIPAATVPAPAGTAGTMIPA